MEEQAPAPPADVPYAGRFAGGAHRFAVRVYYEDTDAGGVVYHANYLRYMERARSDMMALAGADHVATLAAGTGLYVVAEANLAYRRPARLGDALVVVSHMGAIGASSCVVHQNIVRGDETIVEGRVVAVYVGDDGRPKRQPAAWLESFRAISGADETA